MKWLLGFLAISNPASLWLILANRFENTPG
jgi:hypothetical protein